MKNIENFIVFMEEKNHNSAKVVRYVFRDIGEDIKDYDIVQLQETILGLRPNSQKHITTICYVFGLYARWLYEQKIVDSEELYQVIQSIDKDSLWRKAKLTAPKKFISYAQYKEILNEIDTFEEYNSLYYKTLFECIYEGIYSDDLSVIKNLRLSDINENIITLHEDTGYSYQIKVSEQLSSDLKELAIIDIWRRPNRYGICKVGMRGVHEDSIFKIEDRTSAVDDSYKFSYYSKLRKISKEYVGYSLLPLQLYSSGIMSRINYLLDKEGVTLQEAFAKNSRNKRAHAIILTELFRCNSRIEITNFRELVKGHLEVFSNNDFEGIEDNIFDESFNIINEEIQDEVEEGTELLIEHLSHERNTEIVELAKAVFKNKHGGQIYCENCGFNFSKVYGERGSGYIEAHHIKPVSEMHAGDRTRVDDLVMLCSNCHNMVHVKRPWLSMRELKMITIQ